MSDEASPNSPAGWYPTPDGARRYWDGGAWLDIPDPDGPAGPVAAPVGEAAPAEGKPAKHRTWIGVVTALIAVALIGGIIFAVTRPKGSSTLSAAYKTCGLDKAEIGASSGATLEDGGATLVLDGKGEKDLIGLSVTQIACALTAVKTPQSVISNMGETRALDGTQTATWDGITATWRYHPDDGLNIVLTTN